MGQPGFVRTLLVAGLFVGGCNQQSAIVVNVTGWPPVSGSLLVHTTLTGEAGTDFSVPPQTAAFTVYLPTGQSGAAVLEAAIQDASGCIIVGGEVIVQIPGEQVTQQTLNLNLYPGSSDGWCLTDKKAIAQNSLYGLWGPTTSNMDVWAVGGAGTVLHWNGQTWNTLASGTMATLYSIWGSSEQALWTAGGGGTIL